MHADAALCRASACMRKGLDILELRSYLTRQPSDQWLPLQSVIGSAAMRHEHGGHLVLRHIEALPAAVAAREPSEPSLVQLLPLCSCVRVVADGSTAQKSINFF